MYEPHFNITSGSSHLKPISRILERTGIENVVNWFWFVTLSFYGYGEWDLSPFKLFICSLTEWMSELLNRKNAWNLELICNSAHIFNIYRSHTLKYNATNMKSDRKLDKEEKMNGKWKKHAYIYWLNFGYTCIVHS